MLEGSEDRMVRALARVLTELLDGASAEAGWVLNPGDEGLLRSLAKLSATEASAPAPHSGASIAAHVDHLRYGLQLMNRWAHGEDPFRDADYSASWRRTVVDDSEWNALRDGLEREGHAWRRAIETPRELGEVESAGVAASVAHLAYHLGAIRQIDHALAGPSAAD